MIECVRRSARNVKRWQSGDMVLRWTAAVMLEAERQFRRIVGYADARLVIAIEREITQAAVPTQARRPLRSSPPDHHTKTAVARFQAERDILMAPAASPIRRSSSRAPASSPGSSGHLPAISRSGKEAEQQQHASLSNSG